MTLIDASHAQSVYKRLIEQHWISKTGLFASFPDSKDVRLAQQASTYEQAAMGLLALRIGDQERVEALLQFFRQAWNKNPHGFPNFYNVDYGTAGIEKSVHVGPNAWVGLFAARVANQTQNKEAAKLALDISWWMIHSVPHQSGAIAMGIQDVQGGAPWTRIFSTENNLSCLAFLQELLRGNFLDAEQRRQFESEKKGIEAWLLREAIDRKTYQIHRGMLSRNADTIAALDTVTWFVSTMGPQRLSEAGIDPVRLMEVAARQFEVTVDGLDGVDPSDQREADLIFAQDHAIRDQARRPASDQHRMIWYEGLGQYILALTEVGQWAKNPEFLKKAKRLVHAFDDGALAHMPDKSAYPYATPGRFFRDGWRTPAPSETGPASSLIAGVWRLFAGLGHDPMSGETLRTIRPVTLKAPKTIQLAPRQPAIYYGTSDDMTTQAWRHLNTQNWDSAILQAQATIDEWSVWAGKLQDKKKRDVGSLLDYTGTPKDRKAIFNYWALNDVGASYYILAKAYDAKKDYPRASEALRQILKKYSLAQVWDPQGWFWSPVEAVRDDFVVRDRVHYGHLTPETSAD